MMDLRPGGDREMFNMVIDIIQDVDAVLAGSDASQQAVIRDRRISITMNRLVAGDGNALGWVDRLTCLYGELTSIRSSCVDANSDDRIHPAFADDAVVRNRARSCSEVAQRRAGAYKEA